MEAQDFVDRDRLRRVETSFVSFFYACRKPSDRERMQKGSRWKLLPSLRNPRSLLYPGRTEGRGIRFSPARKIGKTRNFIAICVETAAVLLFEGEHSH
jgi:hypothetical protein